MECNRFTTRGIIALVFSVLSAFIGMGVIGWYVPPLTLRSMFLGVCTDMKLGTASWISAPVLLPLLQPIKRVVRIRTYNRSSL